MSDTLTFTPADRIAIVAPHPDDESIATGGLIQAALASGATVRVIVLTDGDANVWPQRWIEKRWRIDAAGRARWGARRREEAREAMRVLDLQADAEIFLGLPDLGLTDLLMRADVTVMARLRAAFAAFAPTCIVLPSLGDRHPDHSAANILVRLALCGVDGEFPRLLEFAVHGGAADADAVCDLNDRQRQCKRAAILAHATQMRLSSKRFLRHARAEEVFQIAAADARANPRIPLHASAGADGALRVGVDSHWIRRGFHLFVVIDAGDRPCRLLVPWKPGVRDLTLETGCAGWRQGFVKLARPQPGIGVLDRFGWQPVARS